MTSTQPCFCGSQSDFSSCCQPYLKKETTVHTAEQLMRSRFSAYASANAGYIYDTYAKSSQKEQSVKEIEDWSKACEWIALIIHPIEKSRQSTTEQFVEFSAFYITNNTLCELRERSRFILEESTFPALSTNSETKENMSLNTSSKQWRYIDGDIISHQELAAIKRNEICPCNLYTTAWQVKKGKKYKHCCGK